MSLDDKQNKTIESQPLSGNTNNQTTEQSIVEKIENKPIDSNNEKPQNSLKEGITTNHNNHQKRQAPKPPLISKDSSEKIGNDSTEEKIPERDSLVNENNCSKAKEKRDSDINSNIDSIISNEINSIETKDSIQSEPENEETENLLIPSYEVTVSPNHSTIIKTVEDSNPDMSHVSIVTIDNGKDVLIQTANEENNSSSQQMTPFANTSTKDEVIIVRTEEFPKTDKIVVTTEYMPSSDENTVQKDTKESEICGEQSTSRVSPQSDGDDTSSIQTSSSDNSANQSELKPRIKVNLNLVSETETHSEAVVTETREKSKTRVDQVPNQKETQHKANVSNGMFPSDSAIKSSATALKRELSDSGSFFSVSSDKENSSQNESNPQNPVILRKRREKV